SAATSSALAAGSYRPSGGACVGGYPRVYGATARYPAAASPGITRSHVSALSGNPWSSRTNGPSPSSTYENRRPFASTDPSRITPTSAKLVRDERLCHERAVRARRLDVDEHERPPSPRHARGRRDVLS